MDEGQVKQGGLNRVLSLHNTFDGLAYETTCDNYTAGYSIANIVDRNAETTVSHAVDYATTIPAGRRPTTKQVKDANLLCVEQPTQFVLVDSRTGAIIAPQQQFATANDVLTAKLSSTTGPTGTPTLLQLPILIGKQQSTALIDSGATHNFVDVDAVAALGLQCTAADRLKVTLADGSTATSYQQTELPFKVLDVEGKLVAAMPSTVSCRVLSALTSPVVLGIPWLQVVNPVIDWAKACVAFAGQVVSCIPDGTTANVQLCSLTALLHTVRKEGTPAWFARLKQLADSTHLVMEASGLTQGEGEAAVTPPPSQWDVLCSEFSDVFEKPGTPPPRSITHSIDLIDEHAQPPKPKVYRMSPQELAEVRKQLDTYLEKGWIRPSTSPYGAPILFARKKDGMLRMCVDYRQLNQQTRKDRYPIPRIDDLLDRLTHARYFSKIDLTQGYHQVHITPGHEFKTAFISRFGLFEFLVLPFGLCNAPSTFQRLMHATFGDLLDRCVLVYLDDILVYSNTVEQHARDLRVVMERLRAHKLYAKRAKCEFGVSSVEYLGHRVGSGTCRADLDKVSTVVQWPTPTCVKHVQQFLGFANYYNRYIKNFARTAAPLSDLLQKNTVWRWGPAEQQSFDKLKRALTTTPVLVIPDPQKDYTIETDASDTCVGAVLMQRGQPVAFFSRKLSSTERRYPVHDRELLAIHLATSRWRCYIQGCRTTVYTDHQPLQHVHTQPSLNARQTRWLEKLANLDVTIVYRPGKQHTAADALSRVPGSDTEVYDIANTTVANAITAWLTTVAPHVSLDTAVTAAKATLKAGRIPAAMRCDHCHALHIDSGQFATRKHVVHICTECGEKFRLTPATQGNPLAVLGLSLQHEKLMIARLPNQSDRGPTDTPHGVLGSIVVEPTWLARVSAATFGDTDRETSRLVQRAQSRDAQFAIRTVHGARLLYRVNDQRQQLVIPKGHGFRQLLLEELHCGASGHFGAHKTAALLRQRVWWPGLQRDATKFVRGCTVCQRQKDSTQAPAGLLQPLPIPQQRFDTWSMDFITHLPQCGSYNAIFTCIDKLTKYVRLVPCTLGEGELSAVEVARLFFDNVVRTFGLPRTVLHDRDPRFTSQFWGALWKLWGTRVVLTSAFHPQTDGQTERVHRTLEQTLRCLLSQRGMQENAWCDLLPVVELVINSTPQASSGTSPAELVFGQPLRLPVDQLLQSQVPAAENLATRLQHTVQEARRQLAQAQQQQARSANKRRRDLHLNEGEQVLLDTRNLNLPGSRKFCQRWVGPFTIQQTVGSVAYRLQLGNRFRQVHPVFHVSLLRRYTKGGDGVEPPEPVAPEGDPEYEIERLVGHRKRQDGTLEFLTRWVGYDTSEDTWLSSAELSNAQEKLQEYMAQHGL